MPSIVMLPEPRLFAPGFGFHNAPTRRNGASRFIEKALPHQRCVFATSLRDSLKQPMHAASTSANVGKGRTGAQRHFGGNSDGAPRATPYPMLVLDLRVFDYFRF
jgi:hypothetical protein